MFDGKLQSRFRKYTHRLCISLYASRDIKWGRISSVSDRIVQIFPSNVKKSPQFIFITNDLAQNSFAVALPFSLSLYFYLIELEIIMSVIGQAVICVSHTPTQNDSSSYKKKSNERTNKQKELLSRIGNKRLPYFPFFHFKHIWQYIFFGFFCCC